MTLRLASFGLRGFVGTSLSPRVVMDFASAFATFVNGGKVIVGRDTRYSSPMLREAVVAALINAGCEIVDCGICSTPMLQYAVRVSEAVGGVSIGGGHHAAGWNALTLIGGDGAILEPIGGQSVLDYFHAGVFRKAEWDHIGRVSPAATDVAGDYFKDMGRVLDVEAIRAAKFSVIIDPVGGAGCGHVESFARLLNFRLLPVNGQPTGYLARDPEPRPRNASHIASFIRFAGCDLGFLLDSDMTRLSIVTETGEPASEEFTFPLIADHLLAKKAGTVITNCCTSRMVDDIVARHGSALIKTPVGQAFVLSALADEAGVLGGEGNGSVAWPEFQRAFDGFLAMGLILEAMALRRKKVSELIAALPRYHMVKRRVFCGPRQGYAALEALKLKLGQVASRKNFTDGLRLDWDDGWIHVRPSRTEQLVRVISEATTREVAERRAEETVRALDEVL